MRTVSETSIKTLKNQDQNYKDRQKIREKGSEKTSEEIIVKYFTKI